MADLTPLKNLLNNKSWILHAATQDLPCLYELGLKPGEIFDTELNCAAPPEIAPSGELVGEVQV